MCRKYVRNSEMMWKMMGVCLHGIGDCYVEIINKSLVLVLEFII